MMYVLWMLQVVAIVTCMIDRSHADHETRNCGHAKHRPQSCLPGDKHKDTPSPEGPEYAACHSWQQSSCCTANFTKQLAMATVTNIDGFHWNRCGNLSEACEGYFIRIECFYRCSPHVAHWQSETFPSAFNCAPVCGDFCDNWFDACADDMSCVSNWITDWVVADNGSNYCPVNSTCMSFRQLYGNGQGLCETLWGNSFLYSDDLSTDANRRCLLPWFTSNQTNPNDEVVRRLLLDDDNSGGVQFHQTAVAMVILFCLLGILIK